MPVITIARLYGAGGDTVGQMLAERLKADFLGPALIDQVAHRLELPKEEVAAADEQPGSFLNRLLIALAAASPEHAVTSESPTWTPPYTDPNSDPRRAVLEHTQHVIREAARSGNVVILGRGGAYILQDVEGAIHVFLRAAESVRANVIMGREKLGLTQKQFANLLGVGEATVSRWETGAQIQQRALDRFLRVCLASSIRGSISKATLAAARAVIWPGPSKVGKTSTTSMPTKSVSVIARTHSSASATNERSRSRNLP